MTAQPKYLSGLPLVLLTAALALSVFMEVLDTTIANVALPHISGDLGAATSQGTWVITSFAVANAISVPLTGWVARRFGEVRLFLTAVLMFVITSWLCGIAPNLPLLILFRTLQGLFTGPLIPLSQSLLLAAYPPHRRHLALAFWGMTVITAPILGPIIGGYISDRIHWGWIFFINIPIGAFAFLLSRHYLRGRETETVKNPIDTVGLILMVLGVGSLQFVLDHGREVDWFSSNVIVTASVIAFVALSYFIVWELGRDNPIVDLTLFKDRNFTVGTLCLSLAFFLYMGTVMLLPMLLQTQLGYTATWSGLAVAPVGIMPVLLAPIIGKLGDRLDMRWVVTFSFIMYAICFWWRSELTAQIHFWGIVLPQFFLGFAMGTFFLPLSAITLAGMEGHQVASAGSLSNFCRVLAGAMGSSLAITLWEKREAFHHVRLTEHFTPYSPQATMLQQMQAAGMTEAQSYGMAAMQITQQGFILSAAELFYVSAGLFLFLIALVWQAKPPFGAPTGGH
ncbi:DHA2 family efflux MFS transporter permease subunit [Kingella kingae]|uniref:DHA2 family efflux MFS transporter permease subunit n=1 Tax=Kingella kingae TaxID=504 RepID=UPI00254CCD08|nr:DHA2 family efflux MFS transporter permease subunit [Kingella kingae]MDK4650488.1 DHA2 family efflux MFS transporter permease subunit [Kingella kingae]